MRKANSSRPQFHVIRIPIVDASLRIIGWTSQVPAVLGFDLRHPEAESLLGGPVDAVYIEIKDIETAIAAGAPKDWCEPWRCLAIADKRAMQQLSAGSEPHSVSSLKGLGR